MYLILYQSDQEGPRLVVDADLAFDIENVILTATEGGAAVAKNRLEHTIANLGTSTENLQAAESESVI